MQTVLCNCSNNNYIHTSCIALYINDNCYVATCFHKNHRQTTFINLRDKDGLSD